MNLELTTWNSELRTQNWNLELLSSQFSVLSSERPIGPFDFDRAATLDTFAIGRDSARMFAEKNREWLSRSDIDAHDRSSVSAVGGR